MHMGNPQIMMRRICSVPSWRNSNKLSTVLTEDHCDDLLPVQYTEQTHQLVKFHGLFLVQNDVKPEFENPHYINGYCIITMVVTKHQILSNRLKFNNSSYSEIQIVPSPFMNQIKFIIQVTVNKNTQTREQLIVIIIRCTENAR